MDSSCTRCGACSKACPIVQVVPSRDIAEVFFSPRFNAWLCCSCYLCEIACPEYLSPRDEIFARRQKAVHSGDLIPHQTQAYLDKLERWGFIFEMGDWTNEQRQELDLPPIDFDAVARRFQGFIASMKKAREQSRKPEEVGEH